ncbi:MAG: helicase-related protein, partial [Candidatus Tectomicrobia bacterium]
MTTLLAGTEVMARGLRWEVVFTQAIGDQELYRLRCLAGSLRGHEFDLLSPFEKIEPLASEMNPKQAARLQQWRVYHQAFLMEQALGPMALLAAQPGRLQIVPYQLVPVMRALRMSRPRLLLADGVGLGKTIEAGFVLAELIARRRAHRMLIVSPAGPLLHQWRMEMRQRFGLRFTVLDREKLQEIRYQQELGANPFDHEALGLISLDFAKQEKVLQDLERTQYDVVVIDEAHHCTRLGSAGNREDSQRRRLAEVLARRADSLLLLTATPHDGYDPHFASLLELLDPSLVDGRGALRGEGYRRHVIRRLKRHIKDPDTGAPLFTERRVTPREVPFSRQQHPRFAAFQEALLTLIGPQLRRALRQRRYGDVLAFISLLKRSVSTVVACKMTLDTIANRLTTLAERAEEDQETRRQRLRSLRDYRRRLERFGVLSFEEEQDQAALEAEDMASELLRSDPDDIVVGLDEAERDVRRERDRLRRLTAIRDGIRHLAHLAEEAAPEDPKLVTMVDEIQAIRAQEPTANILVYTEYTDSQDTLVDTLQAAVKRGRLTGEVLAISGADDDARRIRITERFSREDNLLLVSTDASAEGLNLQARCHHLMHLELPYNPNRLEQRNGRIDRFGQTHDPQVRYLYLAGTFEERLLLRLVAKYEKQRARLSFVPNTLGVVVSESSPSTVKLLEGIADEQGKLFTRPERSIEFGASDDEDAESPVYRELLAEVDKAFSGFERAARTHAWLGEVGLNADERLIREAAQARTQGGNLGVVELFDFVLDAVRADTTDP